MPTVKISSNTALYEKKKNWIDFNCGPMTEGVPLEELSSQLFEYVLQVASGEKSKQRKPVFMTWLFSNRVLRFNTFRVTAPVDGNVNITTGE